MTKDVKSLFKYIEDARDSILSAIEALNTLSESVSDFSGKIAETLPAQLKTTTDALINLINGQGQNSLDSIEEFLDNVPIVELRDKSTIEMLKQEKSNNVGQSQAVNPEENSRIAPITARESKNRWKRSEKHFTEDKAFEFDGHDDLNDVEIYDYNDQEFNKGKYSFDTDDSWKSAVEITPDDNSVWESIKSNDDIVNDELVGGILPEDDFNYEDTDDFGDSSCCEVLRNDSFDEWNDIKNSDISQNGFNMDFGDFGPEDNHIGTPDEDDMDYTF